MKFDEVIDKIKIIIKIDYRTPVFDKNVADQLGITPANFSMMKNRNKLPLKEIALFCAKKKVSINWVLYDQKPESVIENTKMLIARKCSVDEGKIIITGHLIK